MNAIGGEETILKVIQKHLGESLSDAMRIHRHSMHTLLRYIRTLCFLPAFDMERPIELDDYEGKSLGAIASPYDGRHIKYRTTDRFLRELTDLGTGEEMSLSLAGCYYKTFYSNQGTPLYIDGHFKAVWTLKNIPWGKHGMMDRIMPGLKQVFLNGQDGHPLLHRTCPGDRHLTKELLPIVEDFENTVGGEVVVNVVVFDGEGCSLEVFKSFDQRNKDRSRKTYPLTVLDANQYRFEDFKIEEGNSQRPLRDADFGVFKRDKKGRVKSRVALAEFDYKSNANRNREDGEEYPVRCAVVKKENGKLTVIVTTMPWEEIGSGAELADLYYRRWPCQEATFKEMTKICNLNVNHGFRKIEVFNRTAAKRLEEAEKSLAYDIRRRENLKAGREKVRRQIEKRTAQKGKAREELEAQIKRAKEMLSSGRGNEVKQRTRLERKLRELGQLEGRYQEKMKTLRGRERDLDKKMDKISKSIEKNQEEVERWKKELEETSLFEIDSEMDHVMTSFKILYENSLLYAKEVFFEGRAGMTALLRQFIGHYGDLEIVDEGKRLRFRLNRFDGRRLTKKARRACRIFNEMKIRNAEGVLLEMDVKR